MLCISDHGYLSTHKKVHISIQAKIQLELTYNPPSKTDHPVGDGHVAGGEEDKASNMPWIEVLPLL